MKAHWDKLYNDMTSFQAEFSEFLNNAQLKPADHKAAIKLTTSWSQLTKSANQFSNFVSPVESVAVKYPNSEKFIEAWKFYKEYLAEQFGIIMRSRYELKSLERLFELADKDVNKAIEMLNYCTANGYPRFFKLNKNNMKNPPKDENYDPDFDETR